MNKVLIGIPTAPVLDYGEYECDWDAKYGRNEWDRNNRRWERVYGRFNGLSTERQQAVRETWAPEVVKQGATFKFFMGNTTTEEHKADDVVIFPNVSDKYLFGLQEKIVAMARWALDNQFDLMIKLDDDTLVFPDLVPFLLETDIQWGGLLYNGFCVSGGTGEVFGRKALEVAANADLSLYPAHQHWEDRWFGELMKDAGLTAISIPGFYDEPHTSPSVRRTFHPVSPKGMRQAFNEIWTSAKH